MSGVERLRMVCHGFSQRLSMIVGLLLLLTFGLRVASALTVEPIRADSVVYINIAKQLDAGTIPLEFNSIGPNLYPVILLALHKLGLDYETAGKVWGVFISTLTLLPLLGLVRLQFGRSVALLSGFLYAVHPRLIEWGPEIIRDPTFWFCLVLTLYLLRRAQQSSHVGWFLGIGVCFVAAIHLRAEGWLLLIPIGVCVASRSRCLEGPISWRSARIALLVLVVPLTTILLLNLTWLRESPGWARLDSIAAVVHSKLTIADAALPAEQAEPDALRELAHQSAYFFKKLSKGFVLWLIVPTIWGMVCLRRKMCTAEQAGPLVVALLVVGLTAAYQVAFGMINTRYFLTASLIVLPYTAYGILMLADHLAHRLDLRARRTAISAPIALPRSAVLGIMMIGLLLAGGVSGLRVDRESLEKKWALGIWIREQAGESAVVACWRDQTLTNYYAHAAGQLLLPQQQSAWEAALCAAPADVVVADATTPHAAAFARFVAEHPELKYQLSTVMPHPALAQQRVYIRQR